MDNLKRHPELIFLVTILLTLPAWFSGWLGDDFIHYALLHPDNHIPRANDWSLFGLFSWVDAEPERTRVLIDSGVLPWWAYEGFRYQFWRPLAELSHWLDHQLWRDSAMLMHVHSLVWYLAGGYVLLKTYRQSGLAQFAAAASLAIFLWDSTHGLTLSWIANRNALMSAFFGLACLFCYMRWRQGGTLHFLFVSLLCLVCSLFSGETGISTCGYLGAYALMADRVGPRKAMVALWPYILVTLTWWTAYKLGNFGASNSDINYIDPIESPWIFLSQASVRVPVLLFSQWGIVPAEIFGFGSGFESAYLMISMIFLLLVFAILFPLLKASPTARFWALGCFFAAIPVSSAIPADRNLLMTGVGASALLGMLLEFIRTRAITSKSIRFGGAVLLTIHLLVAPLLMPLTSYSPQIWSRLMALQINQRMPIEPGESVLLFGLNMPIALATVPMRFANGLTVPDNFWLISSDPYQFAIHRVDGNTLEITSSDGLINQFEQGLRDMKKAPFAVGDVISTDSMLVSVEALNQNGHPTKLTLRFVDDLMPAVRIVYWNGKEFLRTNVPDVASEIQLDLRAQARGS